MLKKLFTISAFGLAISLPSAFASPITNGGATTSVAISPGMVGTKVADTGVLSFSSSTFVSGTLEQQVYREAGGTLDFYYLVTNSASSKDNIGRMTTNNFAGFTTDVSYLLSGGTMPTSADRSTAGDTIGFDFQVSGSNTLQPGTSSDWLEISTNATQFSLIGTSNVIDGGVGTVNTYSPTATPEPMSMSLMGAGLAGFGLLGLRRRAAKK
jgi:hypothetical protein